MSDTGIAECIGCDSLIVQELTKPQLFHLSGIRRLPSRVYYSTDHLCRQIVF